MAYRSGRGVGGVDERAGDVPRNGWAGECGGGNGDRKGRAAAVERIPAEVAPPSGRIGGETRLVWLGALLWMIQRRERWTLQTFMGYVRSNKEDPLWVSRG